MTLKTNGVIWITGLSGSGKTTLAKEIKKIFINNNNKRIIFLDGDDLREVFSVNSGLDYDKKTRLELAMKYSKLCNLLSEQNNIVVIATISMFYKIYKWNRKNIQGYFEVYLNASKNDLIKKDPKGIYKKFQEGIIQNVAGFDLKVDEPQKPDYFIKNDYQININQHAVNIVNSFISRYNYDKKN